MSEKLQVRKPIYPLISLTATVMIMIFGLITAKGETCIFLLGGAWLLFLCYGYWRSCLAVIPFAIVFCGIFGLITYAVSHEINAALAAVNRILAVCVAVIPSLALPPIALVRNFSALKIPRMITLGMMITLNFFPLLAAEVRQVREAMKTRGAGSFFNPQILYRAFFIPLMMRLVNISDTLALSVETRGFEVHSKSYSVYKIVRLRAADIIFLAVVTAGAVLAVVL